MEVVPFIKVVLVGLIKDIRVNYVLLRKQPLQPGC
jgi:hypothetical protein